MSYFSIQSYTSKGVRRGVLSLLHGKVETPCFMPVATRGVVKNLTPQELQNCGAQMILSNTYHLIQRPGLEIIKHHGGLHTMMGWHGPILTDSGGYQVFSLARKRKITDDGVTFQSEIDGATITLTPENVIDAQLTIGSDIIMILDECPPWPCARDYAARSLERTLLWARRSKSHFEKRMRKSGKKKTRPLLFGIIQGSNFRYLRERSIREMTAIGFDGYAIGGVAVGESKKEKERVVRWCTDLLPVDTPRYLMGVGKPDDLVFAARHGIDLFDCVIPTREARHGRLYIRKKSPSKKSFFTTINSTNGRYARTLKSFDQKCPCLLCQKFSPSYLRHLFSVKEGLALRLATLHNLTFTLSLMKELRA